MFLTREYLYNLVTGKILKQAQRYLTKVAEKLSKTGVKTSIAILMGDTAEQIVDFSGSEKADLIIMASHGRSGFNRWAVGSVAEKVFHHILWTRDRKDLNLHQDPCAPPGAGRG